jgi:hypothetical protein
MKGHTRPDCFRCRFLRITHQPALPYECLRLGFRSKALPHLEVLRASGIPCQGFRKKPGR